MHPRWCSGGACGLPMRGLGGALGDLGGSFWTSLAGSGEAFGVKRLNGGKPKNSWEILSSEGPRGGQDVVILDVLGSQICHVFLRRRKKKPESGRWAQSRGNRSHPGLSKGVWLRKRASLLNGSFWAREPTGQSLGDWY